jgi:hypothetical protein
MRAVWRADFEAWPLQACGRGVFGRDAGDGSSSNFGWAHADHRLLKDSSSSFTTTTQVQMLGSHR